MGSAGVGGVLVLVLVLVPGAVAEGGGAALALAVGGGSGAVAPPASCPAFSDDTAAPELALHQTSVQVEAPRVLQRSA